MWQKMRLLYNPNLINGNIYTHAQMPVPYICNENTLRIYFSSRNRSKNSFIFYMETDLKNQSQLSGICKTPVLELGKKGTFDDAGTIPSCIVNLGKDTCYLYYIGWNNLVDIPYQLSIGLAISYDAGKTFKKYSNGPILSKAIDEPYFCTAPCVLFQNNQWKMWYVSSTGWKLINEKYEPLYLIRYAESTNGIDWIRKPEPCINYNFEGESIGRPWVMFEDNIYKMWYSFRGSFNYRNKEGQHYKLGYAESTDGIIWIRKDELIGIWESEKEWDSEMICYSSILKIGNLSYMFYNGNGFGISGIGYAIKTN